MCYADTASMVLQIDLVSQVDMSSSNISVVRVIGKKRGRARVAIAYTDGTVSVAHYYVLPPLHTQVNIP